MALTINGFNVGTDLGMTISDNYGDIFQAETLGRLIEFDCIAEDAPLKVTPIDNGGVPIYQTLWNGLSGTITFVRGGPIYGQLFIDLANLYYGSGIIPQFTIATEVRNRDGSADEYLLTGVQFTKPSFGNFRSLKEVDMKLNFNASLLEATGSASSLLVAALGLG